MKFWDFVNERLKIYKYKEISKIPSPWTDDPILRDYKFCNAQRHLDRTSQSLLKNVINNISLNSKQKIMNIIFLRLFNRPEHFDIFPIIHDWGSQKDLVIGICEDCYKNKKKIFNNAYQINTGHDNKHIQIIENLAAIDYDELDEILKTKTYKEILKYLEDHIRAVGSFIAAQILLDCGYDSSITGITGDDFLIIGPGAAEGLRMMGLEDPKKYEAAIYHLWNNQPYLPDLQPYPERSMYRQGHMSLMDIQHCLCEWRKYHQWKNGIGMRRKYKGN